MTGETTVIVSHFKCLRQSLQLEVASLGALLEFGGGTSGLGALLPHLGFGGEARNAPCHPLAEGFILHCLRDSAPASLGSEASNGNLGTATLESEPGPSPGGDDE